MEIATYDEWSQTLGEPVGDELEITAEMVRALFVDGDGIDVYVERYADVLLASALDEDGIPILNINIPSAQLEISDESDRRKLYGRLRGGVAG